MRLHALPLAVCALLGFATALHAQMPDPKQMSGVPLPAGDVAPGTVTVRVIRGTLANNVAGQPVELQVDGAVRRQTTGDGGRAEFAGLRPGARVKAATVVDGERLESQEFAVPAQGGIRVLLVAADPQGEAVRPPAASAAQPGEVVLGEQSRFVFELGDEAVNVFAILQIENPAAAPVEPRAPLAFEVAEGGGTPTILNGSSPRAAAEDRRVVVAGPFPPGPTLVQFAYAVPYSGGDLTIAQPLPVALNRVTLLAQKVGDMRVTSPQIAQQREMSAQGDTYVVAQGPALPAGGAVTVSFAGLPHAARWPRYTALAVAAAILLAGVWWSLRAPSAPAAHSRGELEAARERLLAELAAVERQRRAAAAPAAAPLASRRQRLLADLESVYAALDH